MVVDCVGSGILIRSIICDEFCPVCLLRRFAYTFIVVKQFAANGMKVLSALAVSFCNTTTFTFLTFLRAVKKHRGGEMGYVCGCSRCDMAKLSHS